MLVFLIHGVATRDVEYAEPLIHIIKQEFIERDLPLPHFRSSFWGDVLSDIGKLWNYIYEDLRKASVRSDKTPTDRLFRYQSFRQGFFSKFIGDFFTYLNPDRGKEIRKKIARQLYDFIKRNPDEKDLHIVCHSLGTIILWDVLFCDRLKEEKETLAIRKMLRGTGQALSQYQVYLKSIITMGSPILFVNAMLDVRSEHIQYFLRSYTNTDPLIWTNIIHAADIIAYPLQTSMKVENSDRIIFEDRYIWDDANLWEKAARTIGQSDLAMAVGTADAHHLYLHDYKTAQTIVKTLLGESDSITEEATSVMENTEQSNRSHLQISIERISGISGLTRDENPANLANGKIYVTFADNSGCIRLFVNSLKVYHVYLFDPSEDLQFGAYVGWMHTGVLIEQLEFIKQNFGMNVDESDVNQ